MPLRHYPPAQLRYLKARLSNLARPGFWGTAIFLSVVGLAIEQYWTHPTFLTQEQKEVTSQQSTNTSLSEEDKTIAADIDSLPILYNHKQTTSSKASPLQQNIQGNKSQGLSNDSAIQSQTSVSDAKLNPDAETVNPVPKLENPFLVQADNLLKFNNAQTVPSYVEHNPVQTPQNQGLGFTQQTNSTSNVAQVSSLQTPVNPPTPQNLSDDTILTQTSSLGRSQPTTNFNSGAIAPISTTGTNLTQPSITNIVPYSTGTSYTQPPVTNQQPSSIYVTSYAQPILTNQTLYPRPDLNRVATDPRYQNFLNQVRQKSANLNGVQVLPNVGTPTYSSPYYSQTPIYNSSTPVITGSYGNPSLQQPTQIQQYNLSSPNQIPQYTGGNQINGYSYP